MPNVSVSELFVPLPFLALLTGLAFVVTRVARRARHGGESR